MDLFSLHKLASPDFRQPIFRLWSELDLAVGAAGSPSATDERIVREAQQAFAQPGTRVETTSANRRRGEYFQS